MVPKRSRSRGSASRQNTASSDVAQASLTDQLYRNYIWLKFKLRHVEENIVNEQSAIHVKAEKAAPLSDYAVNDSWKPFRNAVTPEIGNGVRQRARGRLAATKSNRQPL